MKKLLFSMLCAMTMVFASCCGSATNEEPLIETDEAVIEEVVEDGINDEIVEIDTTCVEEEETVNL